MLLQSFPGNHYNGIGHPLRKKWHSWRLRDQEAGDSETVDTQQMGINRKAGCKHGHSVVCFWHVRKTVALMSPAASEERRVKNCECDMSYF